MTSSSSGSPVAPGSLVRSSTAIDRTVGGSARTQLLAAGTAGTGGPSAARPARRPPSSPRRPPRPRPPPIPSARRPDRRRERRRSRRARSCARSGRRARRTRPRRCRARRHRTGWPPRGPGRRRRGSAPSRAASGASGVRPRRRWASTASSSISARRSASSRRVILSTSCDVRKPSKKCRNGTRAPQRGGVGDGREVVGLLDAAGGEHRPSGGAGVHDVGVVAEDRQRMGRHGAGGDVHRARRSARRRS